jgi:hypothetical protein
LSDSEPKKKPLPTTSGTIREVAKDQRIAKKKDDSK